MQLLRFCSREIKKTETVWHTTLTRRKLITYALAFIALPFLILIDAAGYIRTPTPDAQDIRVLVDSHLMLSKHVKSVCKSVFFSVRNIGRIGKYLDRDKCLLQYLPIKRKLSFMGTDRLLPEPFLERPGNLSGPVSHSVSPRKRFGCFSKLPLSSIPLTERKNRQTCALESHLCCRHSIFKMADDKSKSNTSL